MLYVFLPTEIVKRAILNRTDTELYEFARAL